MKLTRVECLRFHLAVLCFGVFVLGLGGCSCRPAKPAAKKAPTQPQSIEEMEELRRKRDAEREEKPDFQIVDLQVMPSDEPAKTSGVKPQSHVKPGHWFGAVQRMKANNFDFPKGDLEAECVDEKVKSIRLPGDFELLTTRGVSLPKGQEKNTDLILFAPDTKSSRFFFMSRLRPRGGGRQLEWKSELAVKMKPSECHFVVLAERADNYQFLKNLRLVNPQCEGTQFLDARVDYRIKLPKGTQRVDLSSHPLTWTTIAYLIWDDFDPEILTIAQQQALLDWLHWGGQLVINGPRTLDRLSGSFLSEYLPARAEKTEKITDQELRILNQNWSFDEPFTQPKAVDAEGTVKRKPITQDLVVADEVNRPMRVQLQLTENGRFAANTAELVAESRVGRGNIRVTAFNLPHSVFRQWAGYDSFINACLLGRPARQFYVSSDGIVTEAWADRTIDREDPRTTSQVRYFSRDATSIVGRRPSEKKPKNPSKEARPDGGNAPAQASPVSHDMPRTARNTFGVNGFARDTSMGVAGWNDKSDASLSAADSLIVSAGIDVPSANFVAKTLCIYLLILVPVNWLLFRLMGRVEWAWAVIPIISIAGAVGVLRATDMDVGFVRSRTEIAVLEMQPGYDRVHVTRYIGFYTSLSSTYDITGDDESSLLLPLGVEQRTDSKVGLQFGDAVKMKGLSVLSHSSGMIHTEQMLNVGGAINFAGTEESSEVQNATNLDLQGVVVVRRAADQLVEWAGVGELKAKDKRRLEFERLATRGIEFSGWDATTTASLVPSEEGLNVRRLLDLASAPNRLGIGETVLVGWTEQLIPGITASPKASQVLARSVVVAQLKHARQPAPQRDVNSLITQQQAAAAKLREFEAEDEF